MTMLGKRGIVTGASRGMGRHFVAALVARGARIACLARASAELYSLTAEFGDAVVPVACDVADPANVTAAVCAAAAALGGLDFLVNNAAIFHPFRLEDARDDQIAQHLAVNVAGPAYCMRAAIPHLRASKGQIVSVSSESVRMPFPYLSIYAATKAALETLSAAMRDELREDGIRVTILRSGSVAGGTGSKDWDPAITQAFFATITRTGHAAFTGTAASPDSMADALVSVLALPPDINVDLIEVRAAAPHH
jgi:meso-butanediol dehydrogenase / (S,S)-butanediol dehydrogenase / diacetyl reductase